MIRLKKETFTQWVQLRKMDPEQIIKAYKVEGNFVIFTYEELLEFCAKLNLSISTILKENETLDLTDGVKVTKKDSAYKRVNEKNGKKYYTYNHLVTTDAYPTLMPLRVELHCNDEKDVVLNGGHDSTEIVYVTKGTVRMHWEFENVTKYMDLEVGDSAFIQPGISHSFMAVGNDAELIAVNW